MQGEFGQKGCMYYVPSVDSNRTRMTLKRGPFCFLVLFDLSGVRWWFVRGGVMICQGWGDDFLGVGWWFVRDWVMIWDVGRELTNVHHKLREENFVDKKERKSCEGRHKRKWGRQVIIATFLGNVFFLNDNNEGKGASRASFLTPIALSSDIKVSPLVMGEFGKPPLHKFMHVFRCSTKKKSLAIFFVIVGEHIQVNPSHLHEYKHPAFPHSLTHSLFFASYSFLYFLCTLTNVYLSCLCMQESKPSNTFQ